MTIVFIVLKRAISCEGIVVIKGSGAPVDQPESLVETGKDFRGCVAVLNIDTGGHGHVGYRPWNWPSSFSYDTQGLRRTRQKFSAYHILGLAALDRPNEVV